MFDCVIPTRCGRNGLAFTGRGRVKLRNSEHRQAKGPIDPDCDCLACRHFSRAYIRHLLVAGEMLGLTLMTLHNLRFYMRLMASARAAIREGCFAEYLAAQEAVGSPAP
jgi:queuine tRNA-ribosyltransferase